MSFSPAEVKFLQRLVADRPGRRADGVAALLFCKNSRIGVAYGRHIEYVEADFEKAEKLLLANGLPVVELQPGASRADAAVYPGLSEKAQSKAPASDAVCLKFMGDCRLDGRALYAPPGGYLVMTTRQALQIQVDELLVVENLETFRWIEDYRWIDGGGKSVMVIYRGDRDNSVRDSMDVIAQRTEPTNAFFDFDPAGLGMAAGLPRLARLLLPEPEWLRAAAKGSRAMELYAKSSDQWEATLDGCSDESIGRAWALLKEMRAGVAQEGMRGFGRIDEAAC